MLPIAAFLHVTNLTAAVIREQLLPANLPALLIGLITCIAVLLILALLAAQNRMEEKKPMLVPGIFCLILSLAISLGTSSGLQSALMGASLGPLMVSPVYLTLAAVCLAGVGTTLLTAAWARAYQSLERGMILANTAVAFALGGVLDGVLAKFAIKMDPLIITASLVLLSALPLELILSGRGFRGTGHVSHRSPRSGGTLAPSACPTLSRVPRPPEATTPHPPRDLNDDATEESTRPQTGAFGAFLRSSWKPYAGVMLCWVITACTWGTTLSAGSLGGVPEVDFIRSAGDLLAGAVMTGLLLTLANRRDSFRLILRFLPVSATALLLLCWFLTLMNPVLGLLGQLLFGVSLGLLTMLTWTELGYHAARTHSTDVIFGKAGALLLAAIAGAGTLAYLLGDAAEFVSPVLTLGYLVLVNFNFGSGGNAPAQDDPVLNLKLSKQVERLAEIYHLTPREREITGYLANGLSAPYIADALFISHNSVKTHARHIYHKAGVHKRDELIALVNAMNEEDSK
jgi:DNA-binding CsgD family transcriptional regulator